MFKNNEKLIAAMQFTLSFAFTLGFFAVTAIVIFGRASIPPEQIRLADTLFGVLSAVLVQQSGYWFSRQRPQDTAADASNARGRDEPTTVINNNYPPPQPESRIRPPRR